MKLKKIEAEFKLNEEYRFSVIEPYTESKDYNHSEYGAELIGENALFFSDDKFAHWFILTSASGANFYYRYVFRI